jgi:hypothetical protein
MVHPAHIAVLLIAACLAGCGGYALLDPEPMGTGSTPGTSQSTPSAAADRANAAALNSLFARAAEPKPADPAPAPPAIALAPAEPAKPVWVATTDSSENPAQPAPVAPAVNDKLTVEPRGRAYLFRGIAGLIYSRGMDRLAERIERTGIGASVDTYLVWRGVAEQAIRDYRRDPQPITLIGHSMGGDSALAFAESLNAANIPVSLLVTYDPSRIAGTVPSNVERYINIYQSSNMMGGGNVVAGPRFHGHYASYNLKDHSELIHINIEKAERIHEQIIDKIRQLAVTPANAEGEAVPLRLEVPAEAAIELWDSGTPIAAHAGDTLKSIAATYHVPLWSLSELNTASDRGQLAEGQRIIVPRHLLPTVTPTSAVSSYAPAGR